MTPTYPLWFYRLVPGVSSHPGAVIVNGATLYGPVAPQSDTPRLDADAPTRDADRATDLDLSDVDEAR